LRAGERGSKEFLFSKLVIFFEKRREHEGSLFVPQVQ
jgi:hypothetical protein